MKIAIVIPDGHSVVMFLPGIIRTLKRNPGARITVLSDDGDYKSQIEALGVESLRVPMHRFISPVRDIRYLLALYSIFKRERFDAVLNFSTKPNIYGTIAARMVGVPHIVSAVVGMGITFMPGDGFRKRLLRGLVSGLYRLTGRWSRFIWFTNGNDAAYFRARGFAAESKIIVTKQDLDTKYYRSEALSEAELAKLRGELGLNEKDRVVLMVARLIWAKGVREFAEAARLLRESHPAAIFLLIGNLEPQSLDPVPESYIREMEGISNLRWLGFRDNLRYYYALSDLVVVPSYYKEGGYSRVVLEAMALGKAVIAADSEDLKGVEDGKSGLLVPIKDSEALGRAIAALINDDVKRDAFGRYARLKAEKEFDVDVVLPGALKRLGLLPERPLRYNNRAQSHNRLIEEL